MTIGMIGLPQTILKVTWATTARIRELTLIVQTGIIRLQASHLFSKRRFRRNAVSSWASSHRKPPETEERPALDSADFALSLRIAGGHTPPFAILPRPSKVDNCVILATITGTFDATWTSNVLARTLRVGYVAPNAPRRVSTAGPLVKAGTPRIAQQIRLTTEDGSTRWLAERTSWRRS